MNCCLHLQQVFARTAGCNTFGDSGDVIDVIFSDIAVVTTGADIGGSGADIGRSGDNIVVLFGAVVGWYLLKVENVNLVVKSREFIGSLCISAQ